MPCGTAASAVVPPEAESISTIAFDLRSNTVEAIRRGISVPGTVTDKDGRPIAKARIGQDSLGLVNGTVSDEQGKFVPRGVGEGLKPPAVSRYAGIRG